MISKILHLVCCAFVFVTVSICVTYGDAGDIVNSLVQCTDVHPTTLVCGGDSGHSYDQARLNNAFEYCKGWQYVTCSDTDNQPRCERCPGWEHLNSDIPNRYVAVDNGSDVRMGVYQCVIEDTIGCFLPSDGATCHNLRLYYINNGDVEWGTAIQFTEGGSTASGSEVEMDVAPCDSGGISGKITARENYRLIGPVTPSDNTWGIMPRYAQCEEDQYSPEGVMDCLSCADGMYYDKNIIKNASDPLLRCPEGHYCHGCKKIACRQGTYAAPVCKATYIHPITNSTTTYLSSYDNGCIDCPQGCTNIGEGNSSCNVLSWNVTEYSNDSDGISTWRFPNDGSVSLGTILYDELSVSRDSSNPVLINTNMEVCGQTTTSNTGLLPGCEYL